MVELIMVCHQTLDLYHLVSNIDRVADLIFGYFQVRVGAQNSRQNSSYTSLRTIEGPKLIGNSIFEFWTKSRAAPSTRFCMSKTIENPLHWVAILWIK